MDRLGCPDTDGDGISDSETHIQSMTNDNNDWDSDGVDEEQD